VRKTELTNIGRRCTDEIGNQSWKLCSRWNSVSPLLQI
jgi:hypothetical protein